MDFFLHRPWSSVTESLPQRLHLSLAWLPGGLQQLLLCLKFPLLKVSLHSVLRKLPRQDLKPVSCLPVKALHVPLVPRSPTHCSQKENNGCLLSGEWIRKVVYAHHGILFISEAKGFTKRTTFLVNLNDGMLHEIYKLGTLWVSTNMKFQSRQNQRSAEPALLGLWGQESTGLTFSRHRELQERIKNISGIRQH